MLLHENDVSISDNENGWSSPCSGQVTQQNKHLKNKSCGLLWSTAIKKIDIIRILSCIVLIDYIFDWSSNYHSKCTEGSKPEHLLVK